MSKKIQTIFSLIEIAENNIKNAKTLLSIMLEEQGLKASDASIVLSPGKPSREEDEAKEVVEGYFDGEYMIGDNGQTYVVPPNYASKTQLIIGDRMKWILTQKREIFKLIQPADRIKVEGVFAIEGDSYIVLVEEIPHPIKILKASATFAIKNHGLQPGDIVSLIIPKNSTPTWGALVSVIRSGSDMQNEANFDDEDMYPALDNLESDKINILDIEQEPKKRASRRTSTTKIITDDEYL